MTGVKDAGTNGGAGLSPKRYPTEQQVGTRHHRTIAKKAGRKKLSQELNPIVMKCCYNSNAEVLVNREKAHMISKEKGMLDVKEQRLLGQK